jgi:hypothetical protein
VSKPASSPSHLLDPRKFNRLILECEQNESKYEKTLAGALQQASLEKRLEGHSLVLCDQIIKTGRHFAGATLGDNNSGDPIKLSRAVQQIITNIRKERHPNLMSDGDDESNSRKSRGHKRGRDDLTANYAGGKKPRYDKSGYDRNRYNNFNNKDKKCVICNMNNYSTSECRNLKTAQNAVTQAKNRYRSDQSQSNHEPTLATSRSSSCLEIIH